mmetsp:Transcript_35650/g.88690  ORF Transcript_35650/g.88690 Transcript_35650/m.88690 type:complete len:261 (-) Transcript_35650:445-1227(-)
MYVAFICHGCMCVCAGWTSRSSVNANMRQFVCVCGFSTSLCRSRHAYEWRGAVVLEARYQRGSVLLLQLEVPYVVEQLLLREVESALKRLVTQSLSVEYVLSARRLSLGNNGIRIPLCRVHDQALVHALKLDIRGRVCFDFFDESLHFAHGGVSLRHLLIEELLLLRLAENDAAQIQGRNVSVEWLQLTRDLLAKRLLHERSSLDHVIDGESLSGIGQRCPCFVDIHRVVVLLECLVQVRQLLYPQPVVDEDFHIHRHCT